jgi:hypothetical protein
MGISEHGWTNDEAWRGDVHLNGEAWRGDAHFSDWPEEAAGPEYWLFKQERDEEE